MRLKKIYDCADELAPFALSKEYCDRFGAYDNSGILLDCGGEIEKILFSLDLSERAVARAKETGAQLVVTHHPAIYSPLRSLSAEGSGSAVLACARAGISVLSAHLNLDTARGGIDESLMEALGGREPAVMHPLSAGGYGRAYAVEKRSLEAYVSLIRERLRAERVTVYGNRPVTKVASFCGAGTDDGTVAFALAQEADTFVSSDGKHHLIAELVGRGVNVILLTHYASENYGFNRFYQKLKEKTGLCCEFFTDERFL